MRGGGHFGYAPVQYRQACMACAEKDADSPPGSVAAIWRTVRMNDLASGLGVEVTAHSGAGLAPQSAPIR